MDTNERNRASFHLRDGPLSSTNTVPVAQQEEWRWIVFGRMRRQVGPPVHQAYTGSRLAHAELRNGIGHQADTHVCDCSLSDCRFGHSESVRRDGIAFGELSRAYSQVLTDIEVLMVAIAKHEPGLGPLLGWYIREFVGYHQGSALAIVFPWAAVGGNPQE
jgi:hypothetical protein